MSEPGNAAAIVLAAGMSRRMGRLKMLLPFGDRAMLAVVIESLLASGVVSPITVITGFAEQEIRALVEEYSGVSCVHNPDFERGGMLSSVQAGVRALPPAIDRFFLVLGDQPMVRPDTLSALHDSWHPETAPIVAPIFEGKRGHPVLLARKYAEEILSLGANDTLKKLMSRHRSLVREVAVGDGATIRDIDTPEDYAEGLERLREPQL
jgi:molybdenum cofactor cytidylyltransferase